MSKRRRNDGPSESGGRELCPVCFDAITARTKTNPFGCDHSVCIACHKRLIEMDDHRCPTCRAPRLGMSVAEAEPPPDRNHSYETAFEGMPMELPRELEEFIGAHAHVFTHAARGYGLGAGARQPGRRRGPVVSRPDTGYAMFFPVQRPTEPDDTQEVPQFTGRAVPATLLHDSGVGEEAHTLAALSAVVPHSLVQALLNLPEMPTLNQWHLVRQRQTGGRSRGRSPTRRVVPATASR